MERLTIKNMVCPRCITTVKSILNDLDIPFDEVVLGQVLLPQLPENSTILEQKLHEHGFELLHEPKARIIENIKQLLIQLILEKKEPLQLNYSEYLSNALNHEYTYLSRLFSTVEGQTIERYIIRLKIEKVKEYISYEELTLTEIADILGYSSVAHLSSQFKKETGMTPSEFRNLSPRDRIPLDNL
jgi:AraC-like DNA-binding protein